MNETPVYQWEQSQRVLSDIPKRVAMSLLSFKTIPLVFAAYYLLWVLYTRFFHPLSKFPGPFAASVSRLWIIRDVLGQHSDKTQRALHDKHGKIVRVAPDELIISDPSAINVIYGIKKIFPKTDFWSPLGGPNIGRFTSLVSNLDVKQHAARRRIVNNVYSMTSVLRSEECINIALGMVTKQFGAFADADEIVDLVKWTQMFSFDVIGELYFSEMFGFMEKDEDVGNLMASIDVIMPYTTVSQVSPAWARPWIMSPMLSRAKEAIAARGYLRDKSQRAVTDREALLSGGAENNFHDVLSQLFHIYHEKGEKVDFDTTDIVAEVNSAFTAGSDTTGIALVSILYFLSRDPALLKELMVELVAATESGELSQPYIRYNEAVKLPLLNACCKEGMRMHPSSAVQFPRHVPPGGCVIAGQFIPGGTRVGMNPAVVMRDKDIFGDDADIYNPRRWLREDAGNMDKYMFQFGAGSRTCIGKNIALAEIYKFVPHVLLAFELKLVDPTREWKTKNYGFHKPDKLEVRLRRRNV